MLSVKLTLLIRPYPFKDFTVVPLRSKPDVDAMGRSARRDTESRLHITSDRCATGHSGKGALDILLKLHGQRG